MPSQPLNRSSYTASGSSRNLLVVAVVGPTAVGKTALAEGIAARRGGEVISADSMQVYRGMDIGTAKPRVSDRPVPYHCLDLVDPGEAFSAALFQRCARYAIESIAASDSVPVIAGGTGLYVRAALDEFEFPPGEQRENPVRQRYEIMVAREGAISVYTELQRVDPASAALIHPHNTRRVIRALEMLAEGMSYADQSSGFSTRQSVYDTRFIGLTMDRTALYQRIDARVDAMMEAGLLGEVEGLLNAGFREALTAQQAIGYKELVPVIESGEELDAAVDSIKRATRRYAKRQLTWFRADPRVFWIDVTDLSLVQATDLALAALD